MRIGVCLDPGRTWSDLRLLAGLADEGGLSTVYLPDHFMPYAPTVQSLPTGAPVLECWTGLTALAALTRQIRLAPLVLGATYRHPAVVANMVAALDQLSGGRLTLGVGAGWQVNEHAAYGITLPPVRERLDRFEESIQVLKALLGGGPVDFAGAHFRLDGAVCAPGPLQQPLPLLVGGGGERRTIPIAARYADEWHTWADPATFRHKGAVLDEACAQAGRDPGEVRRLTGQVLLVADDVVAPGGSDDDDLVGPAGWVAEQLAAYAAVGVHEFIVRDHRDHTVAQVARSLESLAAHVAPELG